MSGMQFGLHVINIFSVLNSELITNNDYCAISHRVNTIVKAVVIAFRSSTKSMPLPVLMADRFFTVPVISFERSLYESFK